MRTRSERSKRSTKPNNRGFSEQPARRKTSRHRRKPAFNCRPRSCDVMKIAILPGDGIGPEIVAEALKVIECLRRDGIAVETETAPIGGAGYDTAKQPPPDATLSLAQSADAVLMGAVGRPQYDGLPRASRPEQGFPAVRNALGPFPNLRPGLLSPGLPR